MICRWFVKNRGSDTLSALRYREKGFSHVSRYNWVIFVSGNRSFSRIPIQLGHFCIGRTVYFKLSDTNNAYAYRKAPPLGFHRYTVSPSYPFPPENRQII